MELDGATAHGSLKIQRHKRRPNLSDAQAAILIERVSALHRNLVPLMADLKPQSADYQAITELSAALARVIRQATGKEAPWMEPRVWR